MKSSWEGRARQLALTQSTLLSALGCCVGRSSISNVFQQISWDRSLFKEMHVGTENLAWGFLGGYG